MELHEVEELIKSIDRSAIKQLLQHAAILKDPKASSTAKAKALEQVNAIAKLSTKNSIIAQNEPKKSTPKVVKPTAELATPTRPKVPKNSDAAIKGALDLAHGLHKEGNIDDAHSILRAIPTEHLPQELKSYDPTYIHYNVTPSTWSKFSPEHQEHVKNFHNEIMSGVHDTSSDPNTKALAFKVKNLNKPRVS